MWKGWPFAFLIVMAALQNIPRELYEAAAIDGAGIWQQIRRITLPSLRPVNQVLVLVLFLWTFNDFNTPYVLFGKSAPEAADLISIHIYQSSFVTWNFGTGSAMSVLLLLFLLVVTAVYLLLTSRGRKDRRCLARGPVAPTVAHGRAPLLPLDPADLPDPARRLRPAAGVRDGQQLAEAAGGRVGQVPLDARAG